MTTRKLPLLLSLLLVSLTAGCSEPGTPKVASAAVPAPHDRAAPPASTLPTGATVVYAESGTRLNAVGTDGRRAELADNASYRGATRDGWIILVRGQALASVRVADGSIRILDDSPGSKWFRGVFDTNYVVYQRQDGENSSVHLVRADGTGHRVPVPPQPRNIEFVSITPAGRVLYRVCDPAFVNGERHCINRRVQSATLDGGDERLVLEGWPHIRHITADDLLVYDRPTETATALSVVRSDGTGARTLAEAESFFAGVLPNGRIVFNRREYGQLELYSVEPDGTDPRALGRSPEDEVYAGAVPGGTVLFRRGAPGQRRLYSVDEATGNHVRALQVAGDSNVRAIAPDGTIVFSTRFGPDGGEQDDLYSVRADGTGLFPIATSSDMEWFEALAPDGRVIYMRCIPAPFGPCGDPSAQSDLYSVRQDATGTVALAASSNFEMAEAVTRANIVVYQVLAGEQSDLYGVPTTGGAAQPLATSGNDERFVTLIEPGTASENPG